MARTSAEPKDGTNLARKMAYLQGGRMDLYPDLKQVRLKKFVYCYYWSIMELTQGHILIVYLDNG